MNRKLGVAVVLRAIYGEAAGWPSPSPAPARTTDGWVRRYEAEQRAREAEEEGK